MDTAERAKKIRLILMDVDGTLTDGSLLILPDGEEIKSYNVRDGMGIILAKLAGLKTGIITGKTSKSDEARSSRLGMDVVFQGILDKKRILDEILEKFSLAAHEVAFIGDDLGDLEVIQIVGLAGAVADAHPKIAESSHFICENPGGKGAVREFIEFILDAQGKWVIAQQNVKNLDRIRPQTGKERFQV